MIMSGLINVVTYLLGGIISLFPSSTGFPSQVSDAFAWLGNYVSILDPIVPIATLSTCIAIVVGVELSIFGFKTMRWIISHVPFIGGRA